MKVLIAMDSFKGCLGSREAGEAVRDGVLAACPKAAITLLPLADGGEGTVAALCAPEERRVCTVTGPLGERVEAVYGIRRASGTAVLEMAAAAGLPLVPAEKRDPFAATTCGVGELIADAIAAGCREFLIGIGGSATNDGGAGLLAALGFRLLNQAGSEIAPGAAGLAELARIDPSGALPELRDCRFLVACDVENPLCGPNGAAAVYGPQKGARPVDIPVLDAALERFGRIACRDLGRGDPLAPGAGAAGGLGFGLMAGLGAELRSGVELVLRETGFREAAAGCDLFFTGEGRIDRQTAMGKAPGGAAAAARALGVPAVALGGSVSPEAGAGFDGVFGIQSGPVSLETALDPARARQELARTAEQVTRLAMAAAGGKHRD